MNAECTLNLQSQNAQVIRQTRRLENAEHDVFIAENYGATSKNRNPFPLAEAQEVAWESRWLLWAAEQRAQRAEEFCPVHARVTR